MIKTTVQEIILENEIKENIILIDRNVNVIFNIENDEINCFLNCKVEVIEDNTQIVEEVYNETMKLRHYMMSYLNEYNDNISKDTLNNIVNKLRKEDERVFNEILEDLNKELFNLIQESL